MRKILALVAVLALLAAGCASRSSGKQFRQIVYSYTGGVAGFNQSLIIRSDGSFEVAEAGAMKKQGRLTAADMQNLRQLVGAVGWADLSDKYIDPRVADAILEGVSVELGKNTYHTLVGTGAQGPAELGQLLGRLKLVLDKQKQ